MADKLSSLITNSDASPATKNTSYLEGGLLCESVALMESDAADSDGQVYRMFRVPANIRVSQLLFMNDAIANGTSFGVGVYDVPTVNAGAVIDIDCFLSAVTFASARAQWTDLTHESADNVVDNVNKRLWEVAGLSADPQKLVDICLVGGTVGDGGTIAMALRYVK